MGSNPEGKEGRFWGKCKKKTRHMFRRQDERAEDSVSGCLCLREKEGVSEGKRCQAQEESAVPSGEVEDVAHVALVVRPADVARAQIHGEGGLAHVGVERGLEG